MRDEGAGKQTELNGFLYVLEVKYAAIAEGMGVDEEKARHLGGLPSFGLSS